MRNTGERAVHRLPDVLQSVQRTGAPPLCYDRSDFITTIPHLCLNFRLLPQACAGCNAALCVSAEPRPNDGPHVCNPCSPGGCNVGPECCQGFLSVQSDCDLCVAAAAPLGLAPTPAAAAATVEDATEGTSMVLIVLIPYVGRFLVDFALRDFALQLLQRKVTGDAGSSLLLTQPPQGFTMVDLTSVDSSWSKACEANGLNHGRSVLAGAVKFLFWHVAQPMSYFLVFSTYSPELGDAQVWLGCAVALREAVYLLMVLACVCVNPAFLLVDVGASVSLELRKEASRTSLDDDTEEPTKPGDYVSGYTLLGLYAIAPEKFVAFALFGEGGLDRPGLMGLAMLGGSVLDLGGLAALGVGLGMGNLPAALGVSYGATALGALCFAGLALLFGTDDRLGLGCTVCCLLPAFLAPLIVTAGWF